MSTTYKIVAGDNFDLISRKVYGTEIGVSRITRANPGVFEPLQAGVSLVIPTAPTTPGDRFTDIEAAGVNEIAIRIDGRRFRFWETVQITRSLDSFDKITITAPFSIELPGFQETFEPFSYKRVEVTVGGDLLFTGTLVSVTPNVKADGKEISASGYSLPGVLQDCTAPASAFPLEWINQGLLEIVADLAATFGLQAEFADTQGPVFQYEELSPEKKVLPFLSELAKQRNMVIGNTVDGALLFRRPKKAGMASAVLRQGEGPLLSVQPQFKPQEYYSHITGLEPAFYGLVGSQITKKNDRLRGVIRPYTFTASDTESAGVLDVVLAKAARMFANAAAYGIKVSTWRTPGGELWKPGMTINLEAPGAMIYNPFDFTIRSVQQSRTRDSEVAVLNLIIPGTLGGVTPKALPWDV